VNFPATFAAGLVPLLDAPISTRICVEELGDEFK
jgi:hypothetical protein